MENQHRKITGYRELSQTEIDAMNAVKEVGEKAGEIILNLRTKQNLDIDERWLCIAEDHLQQGIMAAVRSIAKPTTF